MLHNRNRYNSAHRQCAELQHARRHAESALPMGGVPAGQMYWAVATQQVRGSVLNCNQKSSEHQGDSALFCALNCNVLSVTDGDYIPVHCIEIFYIVFLDHLEQLLIRRMVL